MSKDQHCIEHQSSVHSVDPDECMVCTLLKLLKDRDLTILELQEKLL